MTAINDAIFNGADIVNMSLSGVRDKASAEEPANQYRGAMERLQTSGITVVAAAGNAGNNEEGNSRSFPAAYAFDNIISVAASNNIE